MHQLIDSHQTILVQVERFSMVGAHESVNPGQAVVDITEGPRLFPVPPDLNVRSAGKVGQRDLATDGGRGFFAPTSPGSQGAEDVVEARNPRFYSVLGPIVG